jgi:hypothetical protein
MPQLDILAFSTQIFWLLIIFSCLFWVMQVFVIPTIMLILKIRNYKLSSMQLLVKKLIKQNLILQKNFILFSDKLVPAIKSFFKICREYVYSFNKPQYNTHLSITYKQQIIEVLSILVSRKNIFNPLVLILGPLDDLILTLAFCVAVYWINIKLTSTLIAPYIDSMVNDIRIKFVNQIILTKDSVLASKGLIVRRTKFHYKLVIILSNLLIFKTYFSDNNQKILNMNFKDLKKNSFLIIPRFKLTVNKYKESNLNKYDIYMILHKNLLI